MCHNSLLTNVSLVSEHEYDTCVITERGLVCHQSSTGVMSPSIKYKVPSFHISVNKEVS